MSRYKLRTLLIMLAVGPPMLAAPIILHHKAAALRRANQQRQLEMPPLRLVRGPYYVPTENRP
jgi:hypothetical protein